MCAVSFGNAYWLFDPSPAFFFFTKQHDVWEGVSINFAVEERSNHFSNATLIKKNASFIGSKELCLSSLSSTHPSYSLLLSQRKPHPRRCSAVGSLAQARSPAQEEPRPQR